MMPPAAITPSPVCHISLLTTNTRLSRVAASLRHEVAVEDGEGAVFGGRRVERDVDHVGVGRGEVRIVRQVGVGAAYLDIWLVGKPLRRRAIDPDRGQHTGREIVRPVYADCVFSELHD